MIETADAQYAMDLVANVCMQVGPGTPGTPQERARAELFRAAMMDHLGPEHVWLEEFQVSPWASLNAYPVAAVLMLLAALLNLSVGRMQILPGWLLAGGALVMSLAAVLLFVLQFIYGFEVLDRLFEQKLSQNVVGSLWGAGDGEIRRLLIFSGHHDSAPELTWLSILGQGFLPASGIWFLGLVTILVMSLIQLARSAPGGSAPIGTGLAGWILLVFPIIPAVIFGLFFNKRTAGGGTVPGAVDNLSGSALAVAMCRILTANPSLIPENTEVRFITFGSEEAGLRGSRRYVERHLDELKRLDARLLNFEMVAHPKIGILTSDINGTVNHLPEAVRAAADAGERAGVPFKLQPAFIGTATDAGSFSRAGLKATTLMPFQIPQQLVAFYHQPKDTPEMVSMEALANLMRLSVEWIRCFQDRQEPDAVVWEAMHA